MIGFRKSATEHVCLQLAAWAATIGTVPALELLTQNTSNPDPEQIRRNSERYAESQLNKFNTLNVLAMESGVRADYLLSTFRLLLDARQRVQAETIVASHEQKFRALLRRRAAILEYAQDGQGVAQRLLEIRMATADLIQAVRYQVRRDVLTVQQQKELARANRQATQLPPAIPNTNR